MALPNKIVAFHTPWTWWIDIWRFNIMSHMRITYSSSAWTKNWIQILKLVCWLEFDYQVLTLLLIVIFFCYTLQMFPLIGDRYKCKDCLEASGFDLCGDCYNTRSKRPGRFNQQHRPEHRFQLVHPSMFQNMTQG